MKGYAVFALMVMVFAAIVSSGAGRLPNAHRGAAAPAPSASVARPSTDEPATVPESGPAPVVSSNFETTLARRPNGHFYAQANVNGQPVDFLVDTGATTVALTVDDARRLGIVVDPASFQVVGSGASGPVRGVRMTLGDVELEGKHASNVDAVVLDGLETSLLGQSYLRTLGTVAIDGDEMKLR